MIYGWMEKELEEPNITDNCGENYVNKSVKVLFKKGSYRRIWIKMDTNYFKDKKFCEKFFSFYCHTIDKVKSAITSREILEDGGRKYQLKAYKFYYLTRTRGKSYPCFVTISALDLKNPAKSKVFCALNTPN